MLWSLSFEIGQSGFVYCICYLLACDLGGNYLFFFCFLFFNHIVVVEGVKNTGKQLLPNNDHLQPIINLCFSTEMTKQNLLEIKALDFKNTFVST